MDADGDPPPQPKPLWDPNKRRANIIANLNKKFINNDGEPISTNMSQASSNESESSQKFESNYNAMKANTFYPQHHPGPFYVMVTSETPISSRRKNCELHLYVLLQKINMPTTYVCKNVGYNTFRLTFNNCNLANSFAQNKRLQEVGLKAEIPERFIQKFYVIKNVPKSIDGITIKNSIEENNDIDVISVYRFTRKNENDLIEETETIKVGIICDGVPQYIFMCGTRVIPDLYVPPVRLCKNCGRLGHIAVRCKSAKRCLDCGKLIICPNQCKEQKCKECLSTIKCKEVCDLTKCILCNSVDHNAMDDKICPRWKTERSIKSIMTLSNLSRKEVIQKYPETQNFYAILADKKYNSDFPPLKKAANQSKINFNDEINKRITKIKYSKVAAPRIKSNHPVASPITITPSVPVYEQPSFSKVSELEKAMSAFTNQMSQLLTSLNCAEGLDILETFRKTVLSRTEKNIKKINNDHENSEIPISSSSLQN